jgi:pSer/pThr/pTyr-binding forkhead associated (FHA) protein
MKLIFTAGPLAEQRVEFDGVITVGRAPMNELCLDEDPVSQIHCELVHEGGIARVKDLGSTNGTWLNFERVMSASLHDGDQLVVGTSQMHVELPGDFAHGVGSVQTGVSAEEPLDTHIDGACPINLLRLIAEGGMGSIFEGELIGAEGFVKRVAVKTISPEYAEKSEFVASFVDEARLVADFSHPNIVSIHHFGRYAGGYYIQMEYVDGIDLYRLAVRLHQMQRPCPLDIALFIASRICRALAYAHDRRDKAGRPLGLVHRDVSPRNVMVSWEGVVKLTDFGVAKVSRGATHEEDELVGSPQYMSPEQASLGPIDARSDVFSTGLVLYELLAGETAHAPVSMADDGLCERIAACAEMDVAPLVEVREEVDAELSAIVARAMALHPDDRFRSAAEFGGELERLLDQRGFGVTIGGVAGFLGDLWKGKNHGHIEGEHP